MKIIIIPMNISFDTIIGIDILGYKNTLISPITIHRMWIENMLKEGKFWKHWI